MKLLCYSLATVLVPTAVTTALVLPRHTHQASCHASGQSHAKQGRNSISRTITSVPPLAMANKMESDFASAMPEAPQLTQRQFLQQAADKCLASVVGSLGDGVEAVPAVKELQALRNEDDSSSSSCSDQDLAAAIYTLMIERGMTYDEDPDTGILTPTEFDIKANLDVPQVQQEFLFLYRYGMQIIDQGFLGVDQVKEIVQERLIARTGLSPQEFDAWLGF